MENPENILHSAQAQQVLKNKEKLMHMMHSPDAARLMELLEKSSGNGLQQAADSAMKGDPAKLMTLMKQVMATPDGAKTIHNIQNNLSK